MEHVNHPRHYNARPDGLECIEIVRHYTFDIGCAIKYLWRAGLKVEMGKPNREKEIEDLQKALWYIGPHPPYYWQGYRGYNIAIRRVCIRCYREPALCRINPRQPHPSYRRLASSFAISTVRNTEAHRRAEKNRNKIE